MKKAMFLILAALLLGPLVAHAGTQDFVLYNYSGTEIWELYLSETNNSDWEEDVLGDNTLPLGDSLNMSFSGRDACHWDMMAVDEDGNSVEWTALNLCEAYRIDLYCDSSECTANINP